MRLNGVDVGDKISKFVKEHATVKPEMKSVSKDEFVAFIKAYPRPLVRDVCGICDPPAISWNDFLFGKWPDSVVARTFAYDDNPGDYFYEPEEKRDYSIMVNHDAVAAEIFCLFQQYIDAKRE